MSRLAKLLSIGSAPLRATPPDGAVLVAQFGAGAAAALLELLGHRNGFYAFEGALHVRADRGAAPERGLVEWHEPSLWRDAYGTISTDGVCFAEDAFGHQFCIRDAIIGTFEPETGAFAPMATSMESWADLILADYAHWTGHPLARAWQAAHGALPIGARLAPAIPFVLGGAYELTNLHALDEVEAMRFRASLALQTRDLPDGTKLELVIGEPGRWTH